MTIFETFNGRDERAHDGVGRTPGAQPRHDIGVIRIDDQHAVRIPSCEQSTGDEAREEFEPCYRNAREGIPTWVLPDVRLEHRMREREELVAMDTAASP